MFHSSPIVLTAVHSTHCSLTPGMKYYYVFGDNSSGTWSQEFSFTAAPSSGPSVTTRVVVYGGEIVYVYMWQSRVEIEHYVARYSVYIGTLSQFVCISLVPRPLEQ